MPPIDDLPPPPSSARSSIDDLPPPPAQSGGHGGFFNNMVMPALKSSPLGMMANYAYNKIKDNPDAVDAGLTHAANAGLLNYAPDVAGGIASGVRALGIADPDPEEVKRQVANDLMQSQKTHPVASTVGSIGGGLALGAATAPMMPAFGAGMTGIGGLAARAANTGMQGAVTGFAMNPSIDPDKQTGISDRVANAETGGLVGAGTQVALEAGSAGLNLAKNALSSLSEPVATYLKKLADKKYLNAWGATASQLEKNRANPIQSRREDILDALRQNTGFFSKPGDIAEAANAQVEGSGEAIGDILHNNFADTSMSRNDVISELNDKIAELSKNEANTSLVNKLQNEVNNIRAKAEMYGPDIPLSAANDIKGDYQGKVNWKSLAPDVIENNANAQVSDVYRNQIVNKATQENPQVADALQSANKTYGVNKDVRDVALRRQGQLDQRRNGGFFSDMIGQRTSSMKAVGVDWLSDLAKSSPQVFGKWAGTMARAAHSGTPAIITTDFLLQQTDPEYREHRRMLGEGPDNQNRSPSDQEGP